MEPSPVVASGRATAAAGGEPPPADGGSRRGDRRGWRGWRSRAAELAGIDLRSLALLRCGLGLVILFDIAGRLPDLAAHYTDQGILPRWAALVWLPVEAHLSVRMLSGAAWFQALVFAVAAAAAVALICGWHTRAAAVLSWYLVFALQARNPAIEHGGDNVLRLVLFWAMFLPLGDRWSRDRASGRLPAPAEHSERGAPRVVSVAAFAARLQVCLIYWTTAAFKWGAAWVGQGSAIATAMRLDYLSTSWGRYLLRFPRLLRWMTRGSLGLEILGPAAVWSPVGTGPVRCLVVLAFVLFHLCGIGPTLRLGIFPWISALGWCLFLPGWFWQRLRGGRLGALMERLDRADARGLERRRAGAAPLAWWTGSAASGGADVSDGSGCRGRRVADAVAACLLVYVVLLNLRELDAARFARLLPAAGEGVEQALALHQRWNMFAPAPPTDDGWYVVVGRLAGGGSVDPWRQAPVDPARPERFATVYGNARWTKYLTNLHHPDYVFHRRLFGNFLCRRWNAAHAGPERLDGLSLVYMLERTVPPDQELPARPLLLFAQTCPAT